jgi:uncharacterized membrane protein
MKTAIEIKVGLGILYFFLVGVFINVCVWCMNQPSNIYLTIGLGCGIIFLLINAFILRKYFQRKAKKEEQE